MVIHFEYGPFTDTWCVHGMDGTNIISVRCPPLSIDSTASALDAGCADTTQFGFAPGLCVSYMVNPALAFGHVQVPEDYLKTHFPGLMIAFPRCIPELLKNLCVTITQEPNDGPLVEASSSGASASSLYDSVHFVLSPNFRCRYEWLPKQNDAVDDQCIKFAGVYTDGGGGTLLFQIDEAWALRWQE